MSTALTTAAAGTPAEIDKAVMAKLEPRLLPYLSSVASGDFSAIARWEWRFPVKRTPQAEKIIAAAVAVVRESVRPLRHDKTVKMLAKVRLLTARRPSDTDDTTAMYVAYAEELEHYPADVVLHVLSSQHRLSKWWPTWAELAERLDALASRRQRLLEALENPRWENDA